MASDASSANVQSAVRTSPQSSQVLSSDGVDFKPGRSWSNVFNILAGRMSEVGVEKFRLDRDLRTEEADCKRCEDHRDFLLKYSPIVRFMRDNINQLGGDINSTNVHCRRCDEMQEGGFDPNYGVRVCANWVKSRKHVEDVMAHEMVHAWDHVRFKVDWSDLKHAACTEIRASSLSGECRFMREFWDRGNMTLTQQHQACVKRRAVQSVMGRANCQSKEQAEQVVTQVWDSCFADTRPFDEIYR